MAEIPVAEPYTVLECAYITFDLIAENKKTHVWEVVAKSDDSVLGEIRWLGRWRQYVFEPRENTAFNVDCLGDIIHFIEAEMKKWRANKKSHSSPTESEAASA